VTDR